MCVGLQGSQASDGLVLIWNRQVPMVRWHGDPYCIPLHARSLALLSSSLSLSPALSPSTSRVPLSHFNSLSHSPSLSRARGRLLSLTVVPRVRAHSFTRSFLLQSPDYVFKCESAVTAVRFHPYLQHLVVAGTYCGACGHPPPPHTPIIQACPLTTIGARAPTCARMYALGRARTQAYPLTRAGAYTCTYTHAHTRSQPASIRLSRDYRLLVCHFSNDVVLGTITSLHHGAALPHRQVNL